MTYLDPPHPSTLPGACDKPRPLPRHVPWVVVVILVLIHEHAAVNVGVTFAH